MKTLFFIIILLAGHLILSCKDKTEIGVTEVTEIISESESAPEPPPPPPPAFSCANPITLREWFFKICDTENPGKAIVYYNFGFYETDNCYPVYLIDSAINNEYERSIEFYPLSKNEYKDLKWEQILNKIKSQLKEFTITEKFKNSSLAKAEAITIRFDDGDKLKLK